jgi:hypothetical protein
MFVKSHAYLQTLLFPSPKVFGKREKELLSTPNTCSFLLVLAGQARYLFFRVVHGQLATPSYTHCVGAQ